MLTTVNLFILSSPSTPALDTIYVTVTYRVFSAFHCDSQSVSNPKIKLQPVCFTIPLFLFLISPLRRIAFHAFLVPTAALRGCQRLQENAGKVSSVRGVQIVLTPFLKTAAEDHAQKVITSFKAETSVTQEVITHFRTASRTNIEIM